MAGHHRSEQRGLAARAMPPPLTLSQHRMLAALSAVARGVLGVAPRQGGPVPQDCLGGAPSPARAASIPRAPPQRASQRAARSCHVLMGVDAEYVVAALVLAGTLGSPPFEAGAKYFSEQVSQVRQNRDRQPPEAEIAAMLAEMLGKALYLSV